MAEHGFSRAPSDASSENGAGHTQEHLLKALRLPEDNDGKSLKELARQDLQATLQLLAERAQFITGATGAAIALWEDELMVCRASAGASAPQLGSHLDVNSGLSAESVRSRQVLRCDDAETDSRVNRESCRKLGIVSVLVMPLIAEEDVVGVFELFSSQPSAFAERDITALERLGEMIQTAITHVEAARRVERAQAEERSKLERELQSSPISEVQEPAGEDQILAEEESQPREKPKGVIIPIRQSPSETTELPPPILAGQLAKIGKCEACGFPVSPGRVLCVDCELGRTGGTAAMKLSPVQSEPLSQEPGPDAVPAFLAQYAEQEGERSDWIASHKFLMAAIVGLATVALLLLLARAGILPLPS